MAGGTDHRSPSAAKPQRFTVEFNEQDWKALPALMQTRILESARPGNPKSRLLRNLLEAANLLERLWSS